MRAQVVAGDGLVALQRQYASVVEPSLHRLGANFALCLRFTERRRFSIEELGLKPLSTRHDPLRRGARRAYGQPCFGFLARALCDS